MKRLLKLCFLLFIPVLLAACSTSSSANDDQVIEVWLTPQWKGVYSADEEGADYDSFMLKAAELYEAENPGVEIDIQVIPGDQRDSKLSVALQTESLPNIFFDSVFTLTTYAHQGLAEPLDDIISEESRKDIAPNIWENVEINDQVYFYPFAQNPGTLVYNADLFKEAGLESYIGEKDEIVTWTAEEHYDIVNTIKEKMPNITPHGFFAMNNQGDTWNMMYIRSFGNDYFDENSQLITNEPDGVQAMEYYNQLNKEGLLTSGEESMTSNEVSANFQNQNTAISFTNAILYKNMLADMETGKLPAFDARLVNFPVGDGADPVSFTYVLGSMVFDNLNEEENEIAKDFVKFYSEHEELIMASATSVPVRESVNEAVADEIPLLETYEANEETIVNFSNNVPNYSELRNALFPEIQAMLTGEKTPQEAMDDYVISGNEIINKGLDRSYLVD